MFTMLQKSFVMLVFVILLLCVVILRAVLVRNTNLIQMVMPMLQNLQLV